MVDKKEQLITALYEVVEAGEHMKCSVYSICSNGDKDNGVKCKPESRKSMHVVTDLYTHIINTRNPLAYGTLDLCLDKISGIEYRLDGKSLEVNIISSAKKSDIVRVSESEKMGA